jgi:hypothetical protein
MFLPTCARLCDRRCSLQSKKFPSHELVRKELLLLRPELEKSFLEILPSFRMLPATFTNGYTSSSSQHATRFIWWAGLASLTR